MHFKSPARISKGRWIPVLGGIVFFVVIVSAAIWVSIYVIKPLALAPGSSPDGGQAGTGPSQPMQPDADASDADGDSNDIPAGWVKVRAGVFAMGSPASEAGRENDEVQHQVTLSRDFLLMESEVTQDQFQALMGYNPSAFQKCGMECPVEQVSWHEAAAYCNKLSERDVKVRCYTCRGQGRDVTCDPSAEYATPYECPGYRLPTEAEWEYAARANDARGTYNGDIDEDHLKCTASHPILEPIGWFCGNSGVEYEDAFDCAQWGGSSQCGAHPVKLKRANGLALYDMLGNVWEWCHDLYGAYPTVDTVDPAGPSDGGDRVLRGGAWGDDAKNLRAALRNWNKTTHRFRQIGFRVAASVDSTL